MAHIELPVRLGSSPYNGITLFHGHGHRLFEEEVLPRLQGGHRHLSVQVTGDSDVHHLDIWPGQQVSVIRVQSLSKGRIG